MGSSPFKKPGAETFADGSRAATDPSRIRAAAVGLLARREHSVRELAQKLAQRGFDQEAIGAVLDGLRQKGLVSDERYVESFLSHHAGRGQGPVRIRAELREAGVASEMIDRLLSAADIDWVAVARTVLKKKFRTAPATFAERAKQARFLQYRGFSQDQIRAAIGSGGEAETDFAPDPDSS